MLNIKSLKSAIAVIAISVMSVSAFAASKPGKGVTVRPVMAPNAGEIFQHRILFQALKDLGYKVARPEEVEYQTIHLALGTGDADFTAVHWNSLHHAFFEESGGDAKLEKIGTYIEGALQGYLINKSAYDSGIKNLGDLKDPKNAKRFDSDGDGKADLAGCAPGWGCERVIEHHLTEFGLRDTINHNQGAYDAIMADSIAKIKSGKDTLYYTWTPYWVSGVLVPGKNVEWLAVPYSSLPDGGSGETNFKGKELGFALDNIIVVATDKFLNANPAAKKLFEVAKLDINDVSAQNKKIADGEDSSKEIDRHVAQWIKANKKEYNSWLKAARAAK